MFRLSSGSIKNGAPCRGDARKQHQARSIEHHQRNSTAALWNRDRSLGRYSDLRNMCNDISNVPSANELYVSEEPDDVNARFVCKKDANE
ncbi:unnamed protein product, partial [Mesorhabditis belari]|uniref:Uncharacterized protein n=1 Tax=Mesorhabditis belari TaxID=2138241 RepID=A0AAF3J3R3_9BILA